MTLARMLLRGAAVGGGGGGSITMTAGDFSGLITGFAVTASPVGGTTGNLGSISGQPKAGQTMVQLAKVLGTYNIAFLGDVTSLIPGWVLTIDGNVIAMVNESFDGTYTTADLDSDPSPAFANAGVYTVSVV